ncbi:hypothetical protein C8R45DRAFT_944337 [Mycena sanguinolenta]|nr:hypothetical protein C8R45DRAFT_944337 [Mycena sanguinolenta]
MRRRLRAQQGVDAPEATDDANKGGDVGVRVERRGRGAGDMDVDFVRQQDTRVARATGPSSERASCMKTAERMNDSATAILGNERYGAGESPREKKMSSVGCPPISRCARDSLEDGNADEEAQELSHRVKIVSPLPNRQATELGFSTILTIAFLSFLRFPRRRHFPLIWLAGGLLGEPRSRDTFGGFGRAPLRACNGLGLNTTGETLGARQTGSMEWNCYRPPRLRPSIIGSLTPSHFGSWCDIVRLSREAPAVHCDMPLSTPAPRAPLTFAYWDSYLFAEPETRAKCASRREYDFHVSFPNRRVIFQHARTSGLNESSHGCSLLSRSVAGYEGSFPAANGGVRHHAPYEFQVGAGMNVVRHAVFCRHVGASVEMIDFLVRKPDWEIHSSEVTELARRKNTYVQLAEDVSLGYGIFPFQITVVNRKRVNAALFAARDII